MTAFDYVESRADADELIAEFGAAAFARIYTDGGTAWEPTRVPADHVTNAVRVEFTWKAIQRGGILETDERWLVAAGPLATAGVTKLRPADAIVVDGAVLPIVSVEALAPAGTVVMFDCHVRR